MIYLIVLFVILLAGYFYSDEHPDFFASDFFQDGYGPSFCYGLIMILLSMFIVVGGVVYLDSIGEVAKMESFYNEVCTTYEQTIEKSEDITINAVEKAERQFGEIINTGNLAYFELAKAVNENLQDLRNEIRDYNNNLYVYRKYNDFWFTDSFIYNVPEYLKPIKMK